MRPIWFLCLYSFRNDSQKKKAYAFCRREEMERKNHSTPQRHLHLFSFYFFTFTSVFFTMPKEKRLSLNDKGAIVALRGEGHSLRAIDRKLQIAKSAETNCAKGLEQHHSGIPQVSLRVNATAYAGGGGCPRRSYKILDAF